MSEAALLQAIIESPDDDSLRLVYADFLEENGQPDRAAFIRVQIELANQPQADERRASLEARERELLGRHEAAWAASLHGVTFQRGFVERIEVDGVDLFLAGLGDVVRWPVRHLKFANCNLARHEMVKPPQLKAILASPLAEGLRTLDLQNTCQEEETAKLIGACPNLSALKTLNLGTNEIGDAGVEMLATSPYLGQLNTLILNGSVAFFVSQEEAFDCLGDKGAFALARSPYLQNVRLLDLSLNTLSREAKRALVARFGDGVKF